MCVNKIFDHVKVKVLFIKEKSIRNLGFIKLNSFSDSDFLCFDHCKNNFF